MSASTGGPPAVHLIMSVGTLLIGLLLVLDVGPELAPYGWLIVAAGALGIVVHVVLPHCLPPRDHDGRQPPARRERRP